jgi:uncharacterized protein YjdB
MIHMHFLPSPRRISRESLVRALISFALLFALTGCHGFFTDATLTSITVTPATTSVGIGSTTQLTANGVFDDGSTSTLSGSDVAWSTSDANIATVSTSGVVTGVTTGSATITATSSGFTATSAVTVNVANLTSISISPTSSLLTPGGTVSFTATGNLANGTTIDLTNSATWASSNTSVATISTTGVATALNVVTVSTTNITASSGGVTSNTAVITVSP